VTVLVEWPSCLETTLISTSGLNGDRGDAVAQVVQPDGWEAAADESLPAPSWRSDRNACLLAFRHQPFV
jgi:hypothetical protein